MEGEARFSGMHDKARELFEMRKNFRLLDRALAELIEKGPEMDPYRKGQLRMYIQQLLEVLGIKNQGAEGLLEVRMKLNVEFEFLPTPPAFPSKKDFQIKLLHVISSQEAAGNLPAFPEQVRAGDVAHFAQYDWQQVQGRGGLYTLDYLYALGRIMTSPAAYESLFPEHDPIIIGRGWNVENGAHRSLVLRTLGTQFVAQSGMDRWVAIQKESQ